MLVPLALCGAVVFFARRLSSRWLLILAGSRSSPPRCDSDPHVVPGPGPARRTGGVEGPVHTRRVNLVAEINQYQAPGRSKCGSVCGGPGNSDAVFVTHLFWQMTGLMLIGMALFKLGVLSAARSRAFYRILASVGFATGVLLIALAFWRSVATKWDVLDYVLVSQELRTSGTCQSLSAGSRWPCCSASVAGNSPPWRRWDEWPSQLPAAVGDLHHDLLWARPRPFWSRRARRPVVIVLGVWVFQLLASSAWLGYFAVGPVEWCCAGSSTDDDRCSCAPQP